MLKIKDNVDLKELKNFYFSEGFLLSSKLGESHEYYCWVHLKIRKDTRIIELLPRTKYEREYDDSLEKLFDLIKAGLVEKVSD